MIVIPPVDCTLPGALVATSAVDLPAWSAGTTYAANAQVSYAKRNWLSVQSANVGKTPGEQPLWWVDNGPINSLAMFDSSVQTATTRAGGLNWTLSVGRFTAIGFMGLKGQSITLTVQDGATVIQTITQTLSSSRGTYYNLCFEPQYQTDAVTFSGLLSNPTCTITVSITAAPAQVAACSLCVIGKQFFAGEAQYGFSTPIEDRGRHYLDTLGNPVNVERGHSKNVSGTLVTDPANYNRLMTFLSDHIGDPMLWVAAPGENDLVGANVFGRYVRATVVLATFTTVTSNLEISGYR